MTAEEKLKELYTTQAPKGYTLGMAEVIRNRQDVHIKAEDIDLIANLVVERMCKVHNDRIDRVLSNNS